MNDWTLLEKDGRYEIRLEREERTLWTHSQQSLIDAGIPVPLRHRVEWAEAELEPSSWYLSVLDSDHRCRCGFPVSILSSRSMPGHRILRVNRLGRTRDTAALTAAVRGLVRLADEEERVLRVDAKVFARQEERRTKTGEVLFSSGFEPVREPELYSHTVQVDLDPSPEEILSSFHASGRRFIREPEKNGFEIRPLRDPALAGRLADLTRETFARTGGTPPLRDWADRLRFARDHPDLYRLVGTFAPDRQGPESLVAFVSGYHQGDHVTYADAASTRKLESNVSLSYAPTWDLIQWAHRTGADWFDMGGIPVRTVPDELKGIADFKRYFSEDVVHVRDEWRRAVSPLRERTARTIRTAAEWVRTHMSGLSPSTH